MKHMGLLENRVAVVTGASSGLGRAMSIRYASEGASVVLADLRDAPIEGGASTQALIEAAGGSVFALQGDASQYHGVEPLGGQALIEAAGGSVFALQADVSQWADVDRLVTTAVERFGRLDIMVNNAATY